MNADTLYWLVHWISTKIRTRNGCHAKHKVLLLKLFASQPQYETAQSFAGQDIIWFADNEASVTTIIRGACTPNDINDFAGATMAMMALQWLEWIDSNSNPADGLSRQELADPLFGAIASVPSLPTWQSPAGFSLSLRCLAVLQAGFPAGHYHCARWRVTLGVAGLGSRVESVACRYFRAPTCITWKRWRSLRITEVHTSPRMTKKNKTVIHLCAPFFFSRCFFSRCFFFFFSMVVFLDFFFFSRWFFSRCFFQDGCYFSMFFFFLIVGVFLVRRRFFSPCFFLRGCFFSVVFFSVFLFCSVGCFFSMFVFFAVFSCFAVFFFRRGEGERKGPYVFFNDFFPSQFVCFS